VGSHGHLTSRLYNLVVKYIIARHPVKPFREGSARTAGSGMLSPIPTRHSRGVEGFEVSTGRRTHVRAVEHQRAIGRTCVDIASWPGIASRHGPIAIGGAMK